MSSSALLVGCQGKNQPPAQAYSQWIDKLTVASGTDGLFRQACFRMAAFGVREGISPAACYTFDPPERWRGTWAIGFETNQFARNRSAVSTNLPPNQFLLSGDTLPWKRFHCGMDKNACLFSVEFVGRRSRYPVILGQYVIAVDKLTSMKPVYAVKHPKNSSIWIDPRKSD